MTENSGPWDPVDPENPVAPNEVLDGTAWELLLAEFLDGINGAPGSGLLAATETGTRGVAHAPGPALTRARWYKPSESITKFSPANGTTSTRTDRSVLRVDRSAKQVTLELLVGSPGSGAPALTSTDTVTDRPLWQWAVTPGATTVADLTDQRQWLGSTVRPCTSTNRPMNPRVGQIALESDTGRWIGWLGSGWVVLREDTGRVALTLNGPQGTAWELRNLANIRRKDGWAHMRLSLGRSATLPLNLSDTDGSVPITLAEGWIPAQDEFAVGFSHQNRVPIAVSVETATGARGYARIRPL
ncbi:hypothetical protein, partial [Actinomadura sp. RB99]|uniref:hypothetical protein n=1 Tax=Actinomadura sp. RB99 TaxID=2691577 RepID=UPI0019D511EA